ncbi:MAG TPA: mannosyltransferase family protein [Acidimicrobiales bacterium]|nr:mannosyltransferase family protein [Acidimicrobiales bacterium]
MTWPGRAWRAVLAVLPQWAVARVVVLGALALAHLVVDRAHPVAASAARVHDGLLGWDAGWYESIARLGYQQPQSLRFFPLFPLAGRALSVLPGVSVGVALVVLANLSALGATALLRVLVLRETGDRGWADRSVWLLSLAPPAFVLVMGYAEGTLLLFAVGCFLAIRSARTWPGWAAAAVLGAAAGLTRPLGVLLVLPVAVEAARRWRQAGGGERAASLLAVAGPAIGAGAFLAWAAAARGDGWGPVRVQTQAGHHGGLADPLHTLAHDAAGVVHHHFGTALHVPWVVLVVVLVVVCWRRLPASYGAFATAVAVVAVSGTNLDSFERYALTAFPLVVAAASLTSGPRVERSVVVLAGAGMAGYAVMAFLNLSVP